MDGVRYALAVIVVATIPPAVAWWYVVHPFVDYWRRLGPRVALWILSAGMALLILVLGMARRRLVGADLGTNWMLAALGVACFWGGVFISLKRRRYLTTRILTGVPELDRDDPGTLLTEGPYSVIQHPRYVEVMAFVLAYALMANYVGGYVVAVLAIPALHLVVVLEERELARRFGGAYEAYRARVPRYVPRRRNS